MIVRRLSLASLALFLALGNAAGAQSAVQVLDTAAAASPTPAPIPSGATPAPALPGVPAAGSLPFSFGAPGQPQPYAAFVKKAERQSGLIDIIKKDDETYLDFGPEQLDREFIVAPVLASGIGGDIDTVAGRVFTPFIIEFKRVGKRILWISKNTYFGEPAPNSAAADSLAISAADSVINSTPIVAEDETTKHVVVSAAFFLTDFENVGRSLGGSSAPILSLSLTPRANFSVDASRSYMEMTKALPENDEFLASLAFVGPPTGDFQGESRGVRLRMHYSIVAPPAKSSYVPRLADDRVGYFITAQKRFDDDAAPSPFTRYIDRWNFARGPIVYYLTNEIPPQYKPAIRSALLEWNVAFAKAGIPNAIEVRDQPNDPSWDPDDVRYSTVRWIASDKPAFAAYGPHIADPRTGEIIRVEIVIDGEVMRAVKRGFVDQVKPIRGASTMATCAGAEECDDYAETSAEQAAEGTLSLVAAGASSAQTEAFAEDWLKSVVLHESGHNFGLRHNFAAGIYPLADLHNKAFTSRHGIVSSVMHYTPLNLSAPGEPQGAYFQLELGPYDYWAIQYGYHNFGPVTKPSDEAPALTKVAEESIRPEYAYATDEDVYGWRALDPHDAPYLLSSDPFAFYANQYGVTDHLMANLDRIYPRNDRPYSEERAAFITLLRGYQRTSLLAVRYIGGIYTSRDHRGQPGGLPPFRPIPRSEERRAFEMLSEHVFSSRAFHFSPQLMADLGTSNYFHRGSDDFSRPDFPLEDVVATMQDSVMEEMFSPDVMSRLADEQLKVAHPAGVMSLQDLFGWTQASVWDDLNPHTVSIDPLHRALQRRYTNLMIAFNLAPSFIVSALGYPSDSVPLARYQLVQLEGRLNRALASNTLDIPTRAHLDDMRTRVRHALDPGAVRSS